MSAWGTDRGRSILPTFFFGLQKSLFVFHYIEPNNLADSGFPTKLVPFPRYSIDERLGIKSPLAKIVSGQEGAGANPLLFEKLF